MSANGVGIMTFASSMSRFKKIVALVVFATSMMKGGGSVVIMIAGYLMRNNWLTVIYGLNWRRYEKDR